jgi:hypothetical protein
MWERREDVLSAGVVDEEDDPAPAAVPAAGTGPACLVTNDVS